MQNNGVDTSTHNINEIASDSEDIFDDIAVSEEKSGSDIKKTIQGTLDKLHINEIDTNDASGDVENNAPSSRLPTILRSTDSPAENGHDPDSRDSPPPVNRPDNDSFGPGTEEDSSGEDERPPEQERRERTPSDVLGDLSRSLSPRYFIQVVRINVNDPTDPMMAGGGNVITAAHKILYTVKSQKKSGRNETFVVNRYHEDIEWLDHCLLTQNKALGLIIPPLPNKPIESFYLSSPPPSNDPHHQQRADGSVGDHVGESHHGSADQSLTKSPYDRSILDNIHHSFNYDCFNFERYLMLLLQHPVFGSDITLKRFLTEKNAPPHGKFKKGFLDKLTSAVNDMRKVNQSDLDEFFQHERFWNTEYSGLLRDTLQCFSKKVEALYQIAQVNGHFSTALSMAQCTGPSIYQSFNQTLQNISVLFEGLKQKYEELQAYYQLTLGFELDFYCRYMESHKDTLNRRNCLLLEYENSNKAHERAKQNKKEIARQVKGLAAKTLDECSEVAKKEFTRFHADQSSQILKSVFNYANANLQKSRDIYELIASALEDLKAVV